MTCVTIQVGSRYLQMETEVIPPVGTKIVVDKHLTEDGANTTIEVLEHDWYFEERGIEVPGEYVFAVRVRTRIIA